MSIYNHFIILYLHFNITGLFYNIIILCTYSEKPIGFRLPKKSMISKRLRSLRQRRIFCFKDFIYLFMKDAVRERERGRDTVRGRSRPHAGSLMWVSKIPPWAEGGAKPLSHRGRPVSGLLCISLYD